MLAVVLVAGEVGLNSARHEVDDPNAKGFQLQPETFGEVGCGCFRSVLGESEGEGPRELGSDGSVVDEEGTVC